MDAGACVNTLWSYNTTSNVWVLIDALNGAGLGNGRSYAAMVYDAVSESIYVHGGVDLLSASGYDDLWKFHVPTRTWSALTPVNALPAARHGHRIAVFDDTLYMFGGPATIDDFWSYTFSNCSWNALPRDPPSPMTRMFSCSWSIESSFYIFSGDSQTNDVWAYDVQDAVWAPVVVREDPPASRTHHSCAVFQDELNVPQVVIAYGTVSQIGWTMSTRDVWVQQQKVLPSSPSLSVLNLDYPVAPSYFPVPFVETPSATLSALYMWYAIGGGLFCVVIVTFVLCLKSRNGQPSTIRYKVSQLDFILTDLEKDLYLVNPSSGQIGKKKSAVRGVITLVFAVVILTIACALVHSFYLDHYTLQTLLAPGNLVRTSPFETVVSVSLYGGTIDDYCSAEFIDMASYGMASNGNFSVIHDSTSSNCTLLWKCVSCTFTSLAPSLLFKVGAATDVYASSISWVANITSWDQTPNSVTSNYLAPDPTNVIRGTSAAPLLAQMVTQPTEFIDQYDHREIGFIVDNMDFVPSYVDNSTFYLGDGVYVKFVFALPSGSHVKMKTVEKQSTVGLISQMFAISGGVVTVIGYLTQWYYSAHYKTGLRLSTRQNRKRMLSSRVTPLNILPGDDDTDSVVSTPRSVDPLASSPTNKRSLSKPSKFGPTSVPLRRFDSSGSSQRALLGHGSDSPSAPSEETSASASAFQTPLRSSPAHSPSGELLMDATPDNSPRRPIINLPSF
eukprot:GILK01001133.1.p1 GENE.GILK01001133.1~~GILK01001133.1.p1  ORF type:complete len:839 (-),score=98.99 GILK01001133.1:201-2387(-)